VDITVHFKTSEPISWRSVIIFLLSVSTNIYLQTERHFRMVNTPDSYSGGPEYKSRPGDRPSWLTFYIDIFRAFFQSLQANSEIVP
jgi:hypothetical protein